jgi:tRNA threonylcarbamoyladenosine biosynthesis protein TsaB
MILAINTSTLQFSMALMAEDETVLGEFSVSKEKGHFGGLMPALDSLVTTTESDIHELKALVVAIGPGSFTGLRVGLSTAKGLCHALEVPIIGISSLKALASQASTSHLPVTPLIDSRKGEFFTAQFVWNNGHGLIRSREDTCLKFEDFPSAFKEKTLFIGNDFNRQAPLIEETLGHRALLAPAHLWIPRASAVGYLGLNRFLGSDFDNAQDLNPLYLRPPDIRPNRTPAQCIDKETQIR